MLTTLLLTAALAAEAAPPKPFTHVATVEGVSEYTLPNGLRVLLVPDESVANVTINLTVLVGSRHEGYGEKGMAHLLEHMLFKGSTLFKDPKKEMGARGAQWNGTTREDRTNYFETLPATDDNVQFALRFEADRLVNSFVNKADLDTEMTVVRNEFERSENNGQRVLEQRVRAAALPWHNYGRAVIGIKADIERVPVENLKAFYKRFYQPDNAVLVVAGKYDPTRIFGWIAGTLGKVPRPTRALPNTFTEEPVQDGERTVTVRRVGGVPSLIAAWRVPAVTDPDFPAMMVLQGVLGDAPQGRLHQALVEGHLASVAFCGLDMFREPGLFPCYLTLKPGDDVARARTAMLATLETVKAPTQAEVDRAREGWLSQTEQSLENAETVGLQLSEWSAMGDWRMVYVQRDALKKVTLDDVLRVWGKYLKPQNRTLGEYVPTEKPDRAVIPLAPDVGPLVKDFKGGEAVAKGEAFDPSPANIEARTRRFALPNGARVALLPKKTRAQSVRLSMQMKLGTADTLKGQAAVAELTAAMLERGTRKLGYKELRNALERLRAQLSVAGSGQGVEVSLQVQRPQLAQALALMVDVLQAPAFDAAEFEVLRNQAVSGLERMKDEPQALGMNALQRAVTPLPKDHPAAVPSITEHLAALKAVTLDQVKAFHARFYGTQACSMAVVGDFDAAELEKALGTAFGGWTAKEPFVLAADPFVAVPASTVEFKTPDKANAWMGLGTTLPLTEDSADFPALELGTNLLGGGASGRMFVSLREQKGLTYGAYAWLQVPVQAERATLQGTVIFAPQNLAAVQKGVDEVLAQWSTITPAQLDLARGELLNGRLQERADDGNLAHELARQGRLGRTMAWEAKLDERLKALTAEQVTAAVKKYVDPAKLVRVQAGDFKSMAAPR